MYYLLVRLIYTGELHRIRVSGSVLEIVFEAVIIIFGIIVHSIISVIIYRFTVLLHRAKVNIESDPDIVRGRIHHGSIKLCLRPGGRNCITDTVEKVGLGLFGLAAAGA